MPYLQDDLTWCIQNAGKMPWIFNLVTTMSPAVWLIVFFAYGYVSGFLLYLLIQFDAKYKQRNNRDIHYTTILISLPSVIGVTQRFQPYSGKIRIIYAIVLVGLIIGVQIALVHFYKFLQIRFPRYQIATLDEIIAYQYVLMGSAHVQQLVWTEKKVNMLWYYRFFLETT